jgi:CO/xanthine dehydrogenase FAD-binding subunit
VEIREYIRAASLEEAYELLKKSRNNRILGGLTFLHRTRFNIAAGIDLIDLGLDYIRENEKEITIGAYTSLRDIELSEILKREFGPAFKELLEHFIGVQLRSHITLGAHVYSRFGFSDIIPVLLVMNAGVRLYRSGLMSLADFMRAPVKDIKRDILIEIILLKEKRRVSFRMMRTSWNDYSILCLAASRGAGGWIVSAGARPGRAMLAEKAMARLADPAFAEKLKHSEEALGDFSRGLACECDFYGNMRASGEYRRELAAVFAKRIFGELLK